MRISHPHYSANMHTAQPRSPQSVTAPKTLSETVQNDSESFLELSKGHFFKVQYVVCMLTIGPKTNEE